VSGRRGDENEARAADALTALAAAVESPGHTRARYRVVTSLRVPAGFPGHSRHAKSEWDVTLVRETDDGTAVELCLLVEVKSAPDAAVADFPQLVRGLGRLAQAQADAAYAFTCREGTLRIHGLSLQRLSAPPYTLPPSVFYACAAAEGRPSMLSAASKGLLLAQAGCLAFARAIVDGRSTDVEALGAVWADVTTAPHLRSVLRQYDVARTVRESMRHPDDLKAAAAPA
jgi:hypothetical protein